MSGTPNCKSRIRVYLLFMENVIRAFLFWAWIFFPESFALIMGEEF